MCQDLFAYLPNIAHFDDTTAAHLRKMIKWKHPTMRQAYSDFVNKDFSEDPIVLANNATEALPEMLGTNVVVFTIVRVIFDFIKWEGKSKSEVYQLMLSPNFGHHIFFDMIPTKIQYSYVFLLNSTDFVRSFAKGKIEEYIGLLHRINSTLEVLQIENELSKRLFEQIQTDMQTVRKAVDVTRSVETLIAELRNANYFNQETRGSEQVIFRDCGLLGRSLFPDTVQSIQKVFKLRSSLTSSIHSSLPDTSIVYSLTLDWQRIINSKDLYYQFIGIVGPKGAKKKGNDQKPLMLRFMQSLNELELLGFLVSSGRRRDHYERLNLSDASVESKS